MIELNNKNIDEILKKENVLIDFSAEWCMPCKQLLPVIEHLEKKYNDSITFVKVDVDKEQEIAMKFHISNIPSIVMWKNEMVVEMINGVYPLKEYEEKIKKLLDK